MYEIVEVQLTDAEFNALAKAAHELDITLNQFINQILRDKLEKFKLETSV